MIQYAYHVKDDDTQYRGQLPFDNLDPTDSQTRMVITAKILEALQNIGKDVTEVLIASWDCNE